MFSFGLSQLVRRSSSSVFNEITINLLKLHTLASFAIEHAAMHAGPYSVVFHLTDDLHSLRVLPMTLNTDGLQPAYHPQIHIEHKGMILKAGCD